MFCPATLQERGEFTGGDPVEIGKKGGAASAQSKIGDTTTSGAAQHGMEKCKPEDGLKADGTPDLRTQEGQAKAGN